MAGLRTKLRALSKIVDELAEMIQRDCHDLDFDRKDRLKDLRAYLASLDQALGKDPEPINGITDIWQDLNTDSPHPRSEAR